MKLTIDVIHERDGDDYTVRLVSIRQNVTPNVAYWVRELVDCDALGEFGIWKRMQNGERVRQRLKVEVWGRWSHTYYGDEYDSGLYVLGERFIKRHRAISDKAWHRRHYRSKAARIPTPRIAKLQR